MNVKTILIWLCIAATGFFGWRHFHPDIQNVRDSAGVDKDAVVMLWTPECGAICLDQAKQIKKRGLQVVNLDINDGAAGSKLWDAVGGGNGPFPTFLLGSEVIRPNNLSGLRGKLVALHGDTALTPREKKYFKKHFAAGSNPQAILYTAEWCGYCKQLRADLNSTNTPFVEIDVEKHHNQEELSDVMDIPGFPTVYFGYEKLQGDTADIASQIRQRVK